MENTITQISDFIMQDKVIAMIINFLVKHANFIFGIIINLILIGVFWCSLQFCIQSQCLTCLNFIPALPAEKEMEEENSRVTEPSKKKVLRRASTEGA